MFFICFCFWPFFPFYIFFITEYDFFLLLRFCRYFFCIFEFEKLSAFLPTQLRFYLISQVNFLQTSVKWFVKLTTVVCACLLQSANEITTHYIRWIKWKLKVVGITLINWDCLFFFGIFYLNFHRVFSD